MRGTRARKSEVKAKECTHLASFKAFVGARELSLKKRQLRRFVVALRGGFSVLSLGVGGRKREKNERYSITDICIHIYI